MHIPLTGFDRLDYAAWCAFEDFARTIFPLLVSSVWLKLLETSEGVAGRAASRTEIRLGPDAGSEGGARANFAMSGAARCDRPTEAALQVIPPAIGTVIGHLTGRVIWDSSKPSCSK